jgi:hypothetical protein
MSRPNCRGVPSVGAPDRAEEAAHRAEDGAPTEGRPYKLALLRSY